MTDFQHADAFSVTPDKTGKIYIWLTRPGMLYFAVLLVMVLGALNYKNNMGLLLTFLLAGIALISLFATHRTLAGIAVTRITCAAAFAGDPLPVTLDVNCSVVPAPSFQFEINGSAGYGTLEAGGSDTFHLFLPTVHRGEVALDRIRVQTVYPLGLFRSWRTLHVDGARGVVYPSPRPGPLPLGEGAAGTAPGRSQPREGSEDFSGHRLYQPGDIPRHIDWRAYSRGQGLFSKTFEAPTTSAATLVWDRLPAGDPEYRASVMCHAILKTGRQQRPFAVHLPWARIAPGAGPRHVHACLRQLALMGHGDEP